MDDSRKHDIKIIEKGLKDPDPNIRRQARAAGDNIRKQNQDSWTRRARRRMVDIAKTGDSASTNDIREDIHKRSLGHVSFSFSNLPDGIISKNDNNNIQDKD